MKMSDLTGEKYKYKLRTVECIEVLKEQHKNRMENAKLTCGSCPYSSCSNSLNEVCIETECLEQLISVYEELVELCLENNLIDENHRAVKVYKPQ